MPVILGMIPGLLLGVRVLLALDANVAKIIAGLVLMGVGGVTLLAPKLQLQSRLVLPTGMTFGFFGGILGGIAAIPGPLVFIFLLAKGLRGKAFTKEASLYLVVSAGLLAILDGCDVASRARHVHHWRCAPKFQFNSGIIA